MHEPEPELLQRFRARLDAEERTALEAGGDTWYERRHQLFDGIAVYDSQGDPVVYDQGVPIGPQVDHIVGWGPARARGEVAAKRSILADCEASLERSQRLTQRATVGDETDAQRLERSTEEARLGALMTVVERLAAVYVDGEGDAEAMG